MDPRVLVTRAPQGASELAKHLQDLGLQPVLVPVIATAEPSTYAALDAALDCLGSFRWLIFTSATAVEAFARRRQHRGERAQLPERLEIAAIGPATARAGAGLGPVALVPAVAVAEALTEALLPYARQANGSPTQFLLVRAEEARDVLPESLRNAGGEVTVASAYRTVLPAGSVDLIRDLFSASTGAPDAITFTSSSSVRNLLALCEAASVKLPESVLRVSIGPITSQTLRDMNLPPHAEAPEANVAALAKTVFKALNEQGGFQR